MTATDDIVAIQQVYALYGFVMDEHDWARLGEVFTDDVVFDATAFGLALGQGLQAVRATSEGAEEPIGHHVTNVLVESITDGAARACAMALGTYPRGKAFTGTYRDALVKTAGGWRIQHRIIAPRTAIVEGRR